MVRAGNRHRGINPVRHRLRHLNRNERRNMKLGIQYSLQCIGEELEIAMEKHKPLNSAHEAYAVILEELDEFWEEVRKKREERSREAMRTELIQTAAMCVRAIHDLDLYDPA
jgi:hypothetical protein